MSPAPRHWEADSIFTIPGNTFKTLKGEFFDPFKSAVSQNHQRGPDKPFQAAGVTARQNPPQIEPRQQHRQASTSFFLFINHQQVVVVLPLPRGHVFDRTDLGARRRKPPRRTTPPCAQLHHAHTRLLGLAFYMLPFFCPVLGTEKLSRISFFIPSLPSPFFNVVYPPFDYPSPQLLPACCS